MVKSPDAKLPQGINRILTIWFDSNTRGENLGSVLWPGMEINTVGA